jgi:hypothetical protein
MNLKSKISTLLLNLFQRQSLNQKSIIWKALKNYSDIKLCPKIETNTALTTVMY